VFDLNTERLKRTGRFFDLALVAGGKDDMVHSLSIQRVAACDDGTLVL
jgi:hypothetical protein